MGHNALSTRHQSDGLEKSKRRVLIEPHTFALIIVVAGWTMDQASRCSFNRPSHPFYVANKNYSMNSLSNIKFAIDGCHVGFVVVEH